MTHIMHILRRKTDKCLLCHDAPCDAACSKHVPVSAILRSLRFDNLAGALDTVRDNADCAFCTDPRCVDACVTAKVDSPVTIPAILSILAGIGTRPADHGTPEAMRLPNFTPRTNTSAPTAKPDLSITFCGIPCENPYFLSSSIVGSNEEMIAKAFEMGWAGVAFKTIGTFVPQEVSPRFDVLDKSTSRYSGFKNIEQISDHTLEENLSFIRNLKNRYPSKIIIASIMGQDEDEWTFLAREMESAGSDIIECNFSCPHMSAEGLGSDVGSNPELVARYTAATRRGTRLPILAKMTPNITHMEIPAVAAIEAGADGIAAINTIKSVMNIDLDTFASGPNVVGKSSVGGYSGNAIKPIALRFVQDMKKHPLLKDCPISGMGGIENWRDAAEFIALGCETVQVTTAVMLYGYRIIDDLTDGLSRYLASHGYASVRDLVGQALPHLLPAECLDRESIEYPHFHKDRCVGCARCYVSCFDGGHQAITVGKDRKPLLDPKKCVGCQLCRLVCPTEAISSGKRVRLQKGT